MDATTCSNKHKVILYSFTYTKGFAKWNNFLQFSQNLALTISFHIS